MCGRYNLRLTPAELKAFFDVVNAPEFGTRYNIAPTQDVLAIRLEPDGQRQAEWMKWGLIPSWQKEPTGGAAMINARAETVASKPAFRSAFKRRRCVIPAGGFYEWEKLGPKDKQPWHIFRADGNPLAFAGLWEHWEKDGRAINSCSIITTQANPFMSRLHDRMPVILAQPDMAAWLDPSNEEPEQLLLPCPESWLAMEPVSRSVNNVRNEGEQCLNPA